MELREQLENVEKELACLDERKAKFLQEHEQRRRRIQQKKKGIEQKILEEKNSRILQAFRDNVGEATEENLEAFLKFMERSRAGILNRDEAEGRENGRHLQEEREDDAAYLSEAEEELL